MLDSFRKGQRWLSLIFVSVIGLVFVFFLGVGGGSGPGTPSGNTIVQLDETKLTSRDFEREKANLEARLRQELGEAYDQVVARNYIESQALTTLTNQLVLAAAAEELGLHATQEELRRVVQTSPIFIDEEGRFSPKAFDQFAVYEYGSQRAFIHNFTRGLLGQKLIQLIIGQTVVSDAEIDLRTRYELEEARIAYVAIDPNGTLEDSAEGAVEDSEAEAYASAHEAELRMLFERRLDEFSEPERVRARHILALVGPDASKEDEAAARARIEAARGRIESGEEFAVVAEELSEDLTTAKEGGDLGLFARGDNDPALDEAAFALEPGDISDVIRSAYGFHILRIDEKIAAQSSPFEAERLSLARESIALERARKQAIEQSARLAVAIEAGSSLEEAAREEGLALERPVALKRRTDGFIPGLGAAADVLATVFTLDTGESSPEIFEIADRRVLIEVLERNSPSEDVLADERSRRRERTVAEKENRTLQAWINDYRSQLEASGRLMVNAELALGS